MVSTHEYNKYLELMDEEPFLEIIPNDQIQIDCENQEEPDPEIIRSKDFNLHLISENHIASGCTRIIEMADIE